MRLDRPHVKLRMLAQLDIDFRDVKSISMRRPRHCIVVKHLKVYASIETDLIIRRLESLPRLLGYLESVRARKKSSPSPVGTLVAGVSAVFAFSSDTGS